MTRPIDWLVGAGAQGDVIDGLSRYPDWQTLWAECPRGDWMLGIADRLGVEHVALVRAAIACATVAEPDDDAKKLLTAAERWTNEQASADDVANATRELESAHALAVDPSAEAALRAALAVGLGVADRGVLSGAPSAAAESVMVASIDCGFELAMRWAHDKCAAAVRAAIPYAMIEPCIERAGASR